MMNWWAKEQLKQVLQSNTNIGPRKVDALLENLVDYLERRRLTVVPTYLSDEMFEAHVEIDPDAKYSTASRLYTSAIEKYNGFSEPPAVEPEEGGFW
jgi:hypothetical protein